MRNAAFILLTGLLLYSCGKEEPSKLSAYNAEAFAFDIGGSWEVNASTRVKGFEQKEQGENKFTATIAYDVDLITPKGDTLRSLISKVEDKNADEKMTDVALEAQFILDSTYAAGEYRVIFNVKDVLSGNRAFTSASFKIENE
jgi:hypothetical protein